MAKAIIFFNLYSNCFFFPELRIRHPTNIAILILGIIVFVAALHRKKKRIGRKSFISTHAIKVQLKMFWLFFGGYLDPGRVRESDFPGERGESTSCCQCNAYAARVTFNATQGYRHRHDSKSYTRMTPTEFSMYRSRKKQTKQREQKPKECAVGLHSTCISS